MKKMRIDIANKMMWTLYKEIDSASDGVNASMGTDN